MDLTSYFKIGWAHCGRVLRTSRIDLRSKEISRAWEQIQVILWKIRDD